MLGSRWDFNFKLDGQRGLSRWHLSKYLNREELNHVCEEHSGQKEYQGQ